LRLFLRRVPFVTFKSNFRGDLPLHDSCDAACFRIPRNAVTSLELFLRDSCFRSHVSATEQAAEMKSLRSPLRVRVYRHVLPVRMSIVRQRVWPSMSAMERLE